MSSDEEIEVDNADEAIALLGASRSNELDIDADDVEVEDEVDDGRGGATSAESAVEPAQAVKSASSNTAKSKKSKSLISSLAKEVEETALLTGAGFKGDIKLLFHKSTDGMKAQCLICRKIINVESNPGQALTQHLDTAKHAKVRELLSEMQLLISTLMAAPRV